MSYDGRSEGENLERLWKRGVPIAHPGESEEDKLERSEPHQMEPDVKRIPLRDQGKWVAERIGGKGTQPKVFQRFDAIPSSVPIIDEGVSEEGPEEVLVKPKADDEAGDWLPGIKATTEEIGNAQVEKAKLQLEKERQDRRNAEKKKGWWPWSKKSKDSLN
ncbi:MAG TPA: hypothetical protein VJB37_03150 [Patescibacteria group bacterium]|nr:hypothetical protein [Patescibacteria group bacterium]